MPELVVRPQKIKVFGRPEGGLNGREWWAIRAKYSSKSAT